MRSTLTLILGTALALTCWHMGASTQAQSVVSQPEKVGVVNLTKVFNEYEKFKVQNGEIRKKGESLQAQLREIAAEMRAIKERRENFKKSSPEYSEFTEQLEAKQLKGQQLAKREERELGESLGNLMTTVYQEILVGIEQYATQNGYTLILKSSTPTIPTKNPEIIQRLIGSRQVLFEREGNDITLAVLQLLNAKYKAAAGSN